jgi:hypothetical protein
MELNSNPIVILGAFPNPFDKDITIQYNAQTVAKTEFTITSMTGQVMKSFYFNPVQGLNYLKIDASELPSGNYIFGMKQNGKRLIKNVLRL